MTPPEGCYRYQEQIGAFLLGKLDAGELEAVRTHLNSCPGCQAEVRELEPVVAALADVDPDRVAGEARPPGNLEESPSAPISGEIHRGRDRSRQFQWSAVAAAAVFVVMSLAGLTWLVDQNEPMGSNGLPVPSGPGAEDPGPDYVAQKEPKATGPEGGTPPKENSPERDVKGSSPGGERPGAAPGKSDPDRGLDEPPASVSPTSVPPASASSTSVSPTSAPLASVSPTSVSPASAPPASTSPASAPPASAPPAEEQAPGQDQYKAQP